MTGDSPEATVAAWADAWGRLDAEGVSDVFAPDATYVAALSGEVTDLRRSFVAACRSWRECHLDDLLISAETAEDDVAVVRATYTFSGVTRRGREVTYGAEARFQLAREQAGPWRVQAFEETITPL